MVGKYKNKYRIPSARLQSWDYGWNASYFVTICTKNRVHYFGDIVDAKMQLTEIGEMAVRYWQEIPKHFPFVILDAFVIMPNHVHGIIIIDKPDNEMPTAGTLPDAVVVETLHATSLQDTSPPKNGFMADISPKPGSLSTIIRSYKSAVKKYATMNRIDFVWQTRFHDHIIRNEKSFFTIAEYIRNNPDKWMDDTYFNK